MYIAIIIVLLGLASFIFISGINHRSAGRVVLGLIIGLFTISFFWFMGFWGELLWFQSIGYGDRFWIEIIAKFIITCVGLAAGWLTVFLLTLNIPKQKKSIRFITRIAGTLIGGLFGISNWELILRFLNRVSTGVTDPILQHDAGFYLFVLPFYDLLFNFFVVLSVVSLIAALASVFLKYENGEIEFKPPASLSTSKRNLYSPVYLNAAVLIIFLAAGKYLSRFHLLYSEWGVVSGPGWTDVNIRLPLYFVTAILTVVLGIAVLIPTFRDKFTFFLKKTGRSQQNRQPFALISVGVIMLALWFILLTVIPGLFQWLIVEPNEITYEKPYIKNNIEFTRQGFKLNTVEEREFPASEAFTKTLVEKNKSLFSNIRLWDYRALEAVYKQFQEIRLYYEFVDVDIDRYHINDAYRQVMVSARELEPDNLPAQSQTFVNQRFKYTHGYGITLTTVSEFTPEGLPNLLIRDIPPKSTYPSLDVTRPEIYYGELTTTPVVVNSKEKEFDYPSGEDNIYVRYGGTGGVQISNIWRKFLFGWKYDGTKFFVSGYPTDESRIMFHRQIRKRVQTLAPFLTYDNDPYIVLVDGKLYWIIDAYTTSKYYPYSEPFSSEEYIEYKEGKQTKLLTTDVGYNLNGVNYIRNSVKVVINAYNGNTDFYIFDEKDPIVKVWSKIYPDMFKERDEMPAGLRKHVRYPADLLLVQGLVYAKYHMSDPAVFYNQEDLWIRATEKYYQHIQPVEPYYIMWELPNTDEPEYSLILPFTPKKRQVLIGWIAGMCDGDNYGRFLAYKFPKEKRILGPQQVETKIDQDSYLSGQLSLWDQRGSSVIRGNVLAIPIDETLIYVEPIYLQAETAAYPELRLVAVMHGDNLSYAETFDKALEGIFKGEVKNNIGPGNEKKLKATSISDLIDQANTAFENYLKFTSKKKYQQAANALQNLQESLKKLSDMNSSGQ